ncbi:hypothetical protein HELRODRAFT_194397 [Helobdella robusta]|uniref:Gamma-glutamyltransferase n=1 Tax=Helobdella robusta TaxID=6412 RepID=T1FW06_HELRO|nr:hypothetical protein HELRODRAFT_194397 [Helobdella robusta]ESN92135.1 hypothetical protein HELRODRAFT_194397 [Helobdella robusta]
MNSSNNDNFSNSIVNKAYDQDGDVVDDDQISRSSTSAENITTSDTMAIIEVPMKKIPILNCEIQEEFRNIILFSIFFSASITIALICTIYLGPPPADLHAAVSSRNGRCSKLGTPMLLKGGNIVDTAVAVSLCEAVLNPAEYGLGSCGMIIIQDQRNNVTNAIDFACSTIKYQKNESPSVEIPTLLKGLALVHGKFGHWRWSDVMRPVLDIINEENSNYGERSKFNELFNSIAQNGIQSSFYEGNVAKEIINIISNTSKDVKSEFQPNELSSYTAQLIDPIGLLFNGKYIESPSGKASLSMFLLLDTLQLLISSGKTQWNSTDYYHYYIEAVKLVTKTLEANYTYVYDMNNYGRKLLAIQLASAIKNTSSSSAAAAVAATTTSPPSSTNSFQTGSGNYDSHNDNNVFSNKSDNGYNNNAKDDGDEADVNLMLLSKSNSSLINIVGPNDGILSMITWSNTGHDIITKEHGITLNERLASADVLYSNRGYSESYISSLVHDTIKTCGLRLAISGSSYLDVSQVIINIFGLHMNQSEAVTRPRLYVIDGNIYCEVELFILIIHIDGIPGSVIEMLLKRGHASIHPINKLEKSPINSGMSRAVSIVWKDMEETGTISDPRDNYEVHNV